VISKRLSVALFTPLPPSQSGVADYAARLLPELAELVDLELFIDMEAPPGPLPETGYPTHQVAHIDWLRRFRRYDMFVFFIGNSGFHVRSLGKLGRLGGVVVAHDIHLAGLYTLGSPSGEPLDQTLARLYGEDLAREVRSVGRGAQGITAMIRTREVLRRHNVYLTKELVRWADRVLVHSEHAARIVCAENPELAERIGVIPFGFPAPAERERQATTGVVSSFGIVAPEKDAAIIAGVAGILAERAPDVEVRFVGPIEPSFAEHLGEVARLRSPTARIRFTGRLDRDAYVGELFQATVGVQLRAVFNGEASAAVADCLAAGLPTIVPDCGWFAELPRDVVEHVPFDVGPDGVADAIMGLLADPVRRSTLSARAQEHAAANTFKAVAERLAGDIEGLIARSGRQS
jgi:glycosyltransferase involved in cell wall biosynthesis